MNEIDQKRFVDRAICRNEGVLRKAFSFDEKYIVSLIDLQKTTNDFFGQKMIESFLVAKSAIEEIDCRAWSVLTFYATLATEKESANELFDTLISKEFDEI